MDRERDDRRGPAVAAEGPIEETRATARRTGSGSSRTTRSPTTGYYNVVANPTLWFLQHYLWELAATPDLGAGVPTPGTTATPPVNAAFADAVLDELEREPDAAVFFHDYHLYLAPRLVRERAPDALPAALRPHPVAAVGLLARAAASDVRAAVHDGLLANDVVGFHTTAGGGTSFGRCEDVLGADVRPERSRRPRRPRAPTSSRIRSRVDPAEFDALRRASGGARRRSAASSQSGPSC